MKFERIFVHCSATEYGSALLFDAWHKVRGWTGIGYHFVVSNGLYSGFQKSKWPFADGSVEAGRHLDDDSTFEPNELGSHTYGFNSGSVGVCIIGNRRFTTKQYKSSKSLILYLLEKFGLTVNDVFGHYEAGLIDPRYETEKTCPNIWMPDYRVYLSGSIDEMQLQTRQKKYMAKIFG